MPEKQSNWNTSIEKSRLIDAWTDKNVYTTTGFTDVVRYDYEDNKEFQDKGIDVTFNLNGKYYVCDEKCAAENVNKQLPTFAFALSQTFKDNRNLRHYDWFLREDEENDSYLIQYIDKAVNEDGTLQNASTLTEEGIRQMTCILVRKERIYEYLEEHMEMTKERLKKANSYMLDNNLEYYPTFKEGRNYRYGWRLHRDFNFPEQTVNILIRKDELIKISDWYKTITVNG